MHRSCIEFLKRFKRKRGTVPRAPLKGWAPGLSVLASERSSAGSLSTELKLEAHRQLRLAWITHAHAQEAVKIEQGWRHQRIHVVLVVEGVKHLHGRNESHVLAKLEGTRGAPIE